ncbi:AMP-binding enzyme [Aneurinibacillus aneurinilyticus ATCC 12856]|uniref:AMP-binding enzyme n=2 Tax=Aneurinibacillus aneurinilyticus TaxID=1391 RepID=U1WTZ2_ANEAE|nr:AMP-binding enzyme [Aneurinibacillus aneurinilyticus ATCC 12856]
MLVKIHNQVDYLLLNQAINIVISESDSLRMRLKQQGDQEPLQYIAEHQEREFDVLDFSSENDSGAFENWIDQKIQEPFNLFESDLFYFSLIKVSDDENAVFCNVHHIISDGLSMNLMGNRIIDHYLHLLKGKETHKNFGNSYIQFLNNEESYLNSDRFEKDENFWLEEFETTPAITGIKSYHPYLTSTKSLRETFVVPNELKCKIEEFSQSYGISLNSIFVAALMLAFQRWTSTDDVVVGVVYGNRTMKVEKDIMGMMVNLVPLRMNIEHEEEALAFFKRVAKKQMKVLRHQKYPFNLLSEKIKKTNKSFDRFFGITIDYRPLNLMDQVDYELHWMPNGHEASDFAIHIEHRLDSGDLALLVDYREKLFALQDITDFVNCMLVLLENISNDPMQKIKNINILSEKEKEKILVTFNETNVDFSLNKTIHQLFEEQVIRHPEEIAVVYEEQRLTYRELHERSNQLAHYLQQQGVGPESLVGLCVERSLEMMVGILGILKAGGAYVPLDPTYPEQRLHYIVEDARIQVLVTQERLQGQQWLPETIQTICLDRDHEKMAQESVMSPVTGVTAKNLAYVIYTSGSTGNPKGVMVEHHHVTRLFKATEHWYQFDEKDTWTLFHSYAFDFSVWEMWGALLYGGRLVVVPYWISRSPKDFYHLLVKEKVTVLNQTPSAFRQLIQVCEQEEGEDRRFVLRYVIFGGEALKPASLLPWFERYGDKQPQLINMYGITETTVHVTYYPLTREDALLSSGSTIGKRIPDLQVYLLDANRQPVPIGVAGEMYIGGEGVARGYLHRPELTAERFISYPLGDQSKRLYRTGDVARYLPNGDLEYLGRIDHQVKIRGYRIELGEIESTLHTHPLVKEATVIVREDEPGDKRLVAYVVGEGSAAEWRGHLQARLPGYMVPAHFVAIEAFPLTANGKVDHKALPAPTPQKTEEGYTAPRNECEQALVSIWKQVLGVKQVGIHDNFFEAGGDSILSIQIVSRANQAGWKFTPKQLFEHQTIAELAQVAEEAQDIQAEQGVVTGDVLLTPIQEWFFEQGQPHPHHWNQSMLLRTRERMEVERLEEALQAMVIHHDALRLRYDLLPNGRWKQRNEGIEEQTILTVIKLDETPQEEWHHVIQREMDTAQASLHLQQGPLMRAVYFDEGENGSGRFFWTIHHQAVDGVSWRILLEDLQTVYSQAKEGQKIHLPAKSTSFKEWSERLYAYSQSGISQEVEEYWRKQSEIEVSTLPKDYAVEEAREASAEQVTVVLGEKETHALLQEIAVTHRAHMNEVLLAALVQATADWTGHPVLSVDVEGHGREEILEGVDLSRTVGWFTSIYPVHLDMKGAKTPVEALKAVKEQIRQIPNKGVDYGILRYLHPGIGSIFQSQPKPSISFNYLGQFDQTFSQEAMFTQETGFARVDHAPESKLSHLIEVVGIVTDGKLQLTWIYSREQFAIATIQEVAENMLRKLDLLIHSSATEAAFTVSDFALANLTENEMNKILSKMTKKRGK